MKFIHRKDGQIVLDDYMAYLDNVLHELPEASRHFAKLPYRYEPSHHHCPHDSWVESVSIQELAEGERKQRRKLEINARFWGAYHDGYFTLLYRDVIQYTLSSKVTSKTGIIGHGDWIVDELLLISPGVIAHEIEFSFGSWKIECRDLEYAWQSVQ